VQPQLRKTKEKGSGGEGGWCILKERLLKIFFYDREFFYLLKVKLY